MSGKREVYLHVCEVCGRTEILTPQEAYDNGWDYPPMMGFFGIVSPRTCPDCSIKGTLWEALVRNHVKTEDLSENQKKTMDRILHEPESIMIPEEEEHA